MDFEFLKGTEIIVGLVIAIVGGLWSLIAFFARRAKQRDDEIKSEIKSEIKTSSDGDRTRLGRVEAEVKRLDKRVDDVDRKMVAGFHEVEKQMAHFEKELVSVARKDDLTGIKITQAGMDSRMGTLVENDRRFLEMLTGQGESIGRIAAALGRERKE